jgi:thiamine pyrophosphate-dependent acetolactate synthase large subunit-like protein
MNGAEGFGLRSFHIEMPRELEKGLVEAFAILEPVFLDGVTESEMTELPPVYSWLKAAEKRRNDAERLSLTRLLTPSQKAVMLYLIE